MKTAVRALAVVLAAVIAAPALALGAGEHTVRYLMGTWCDLVIFDPPPEADLAESAFEEIARLEHVLSSWDALREVSQLNARAGRGPQAVSADLAAVAAESASMCATTGGAFDATVAPLLTAWGFYTESPARPAPEAGSAAAAEVGCDRVRVQRDSQWIALSAGAALDFGAIGNSLRWKPSGSL